MIERLREQANHMDIIFRIKQRGAFAAEFYRPKGSSEKLMAAPFIILTRQSFDSTTQCAQGLQPCKVSNAEDAFSEATPPVNRNARTPY